MQVSNNRKTIKSTSNATYPVNSVYAKKSAVKPKIIIILFVLSGVVALQFYLIQLFDVKDGEVLVKPVLDLNANNNSFNNNVVPSSKIIPPIITKVEKESFEKQTASFELINREEKVNNKKEEEEEIKFDLNDLEKQLKELQQLEVDGGKEPALMEEEKTTSTKEEIIKPPPSLFLLNDEQPLPHSSSSSSSKIIHVHTHHTSSFYSKHCKNRIFLFKSSPVLPSLVYFLKTGKEAVQAAWKDAFLRAGFQETINPELVIKTKQKANDL